MKIRRILKKVLSLFMILLFILLILFVLVFLFFTFYPSVGRYPTKAMREQYAERTPYYINGRFHNINKYSLMGGKRSKRKATHTRPTGKIPVIKHENIPSVSETELAITWLGHSSLLIQTAGMNILIDPIFSETVSPVSFIGGKRFSEVPIKPENLPLIDVVLISHNHYDHLDYSSIKQIDDKVKQYVVPLGVESYLMGWGVDESKITNMAWWEEIYIGDVQFAFVPSLHYAIRNPFRAGQTWWGGFLLKDGRHTVYFTGDSGYDGDIFSEIFERYGAIDVFLTDTGQYNTAWAQSHMTPAEAFKAAEDVHAKWVIPVHWGAFALSNHNWYAPPQLLIEQAENSTINIATPLIGETVLYDDIENYQQRWWKDMD